MKENKKSLIIGGVVGLLLIIAIVIMFSVRKDKEKGLETNTEISTEIENNTPQKIVTPIVPVKRPVVKDSYASALAEYSKNGRRVQFDDACQASPYASTFANGTTIMLDNRSSKNRAIRIGAKTYNVSAYSYELAKLSVTKSPTTYYVDCDSQQNPATIIVQ